MYPKTFGSQINGFQYETLLIDCGVGPEEEIFSVPYELREEFFQRIRSIVITHGHQDHWNLLISKPRIPVYATPTTARFIAFQAQHQPAIGGVLRDLVLFKPGDTLTIGLDQIETFPVIHSTPESCGLYFKLRDTRILHLGEFKFQGLEVEARLQLKKTLQCLGERGVDVLVLDAQNIETPDFTPSEREVLESLATRLLEKIPGRVIITAFGSNLKRVEGLIKIARALKRSIQIKGSGMKNAAKILGIPWREEDPSLILISGCQGEEGSALWSATKGKGDLDLGPEDTVIFSSRAIPGKEEGVKDLVGDLLQREVVVYLNYGEKGRLSLGEISEIKEGFTHSSGHASYEDVKLALELTRPKQVFVRPNEPGVIEEMRQLCRRMGIEFLEEKPPEIKILSLREKLKKFQEKNSRKEEAKCNKLVEPLRKE